MRNPMRTTSERFTVASDQIRRRVFTTLTEGEEARILEECDRVEVGRGEILLRKGDSTNAFYIVCEGELHVIDEKPGKRFLLSALRERDLFGEMSFLDEGPRSATVVAATDAVVLRFTKEDFIRLMVEDAETGARLLLAVGLLLVDRLRKADSALSALSPGGDWNNPAYRRLEGAIRGFEPDEQEGSKEEEAAT
jgi:CRP-like cAMP-binding protein